MVQSRGMASKKHKKIIKLAKGYRGRANRCYSVAYHRVLKAQQYAYRDRKVRVSSPTASSLLLVCVCDERTALTVVLLCLCCLLGEEARDAQAVDSPSQCRVANVRPPLQQPDQYDGQQQNSTGSQGARRHGHHGAAQLPVGRRGGEEYLPQGVNIVTINDY